MKKTNLLLLSLILSLSLSYAQSGGKGSYAFLNLVTSPRIAALGGNSLAVWDHDLTAAAVNPSLITPNLSNSIALNFVDYYTDVSYGSVYFSRTFKKYGSFTGGIHYIDYGKFDAANTGGELTGTFKAAEYAPHIGWGRSLDSNFSIGANLKPVFSYLDDVRSFGLGVDIGAAYHNEHNLTLTFLARNVGRQITKEGGNEETEAYPFTMEIGVSKRLKHMPFRYFITYHHIEKFDLTYADPLTDKPEVDPLTNEPVKEDKIGDFADKFARHFIIGGEFLPSKNFSVRMGYNYMRRQELGVDTRMSTVGFSWGFGFRIRQFQFNYARSTHHLAGSPNYINITADLNRWIH